MNNQAQGPWKTLVLNGCVLAIYVPLRLEWSESAPKPVFICTFYICAFLYLYIFTMFIVAYILLSFYLWYLFRLTDLSFCDILYSIKPMKRR